MATSGAKGRRWSDLPDLFLNLVARRLSLVDHMRFGLVCKSWRSVAIGSPPCRRPPWLLARSLDCREFVCYNLWEDRTIRFLVPSELSGWNCCGASHGWLFMAGPDGPRLSGRELCLLNPVTNARIDLPPRPHRFFEFLDPYGALSSDPATAAARGDRVVVVVDYRGHTLICRLGDKRWTLLGDITLIRSIAIAFHKGLVHMMKQDHTLVTYDIDYNKSRIVPRCSVDTWKEWTCYLVEDGREGADLLQVLVELGGCVVLKLVGGSSLQWVRMRNLGGGALFVSERHSELVSADICVAMGMKGDCVYELSKSFLLREMSMKDESEPAAICYHLPATKSDIFWFSPSICPPSNKRKRVEKIEHSLSLKKKTEGSWTKRAIESDSQQPISCSDNTADRCDSACAQVIHPKPDTSCNESAPFSTTRDFQEQMESADTGFNGKELEVRVDRHLEHKSNVTEKVSIYLTGPSMAKLPENDTKKEIHDNVLELECSNPISGSTQAANLLDGIPKATDTHIDVPATEAGNHFMESRDNTTEEFKVPSLELSLRSSRSNDEDGITRKAVRNVLRHSDQSAFSRYNTSAASSQAPSGWGKSVSLPSDRRLQVVKTDLTDTNMIASSIAALTPGTNGSINDHDKGSTTKNVLFRLEPGMEKSASSSAVGCLNLSTFYRVQHGTSTQQVTQKEIDNAASAIAGQHMGVHHQVQLQHHHHHYHHHHYHVHGMQELQPTANHDQSLLTHMEAVAPQCVSSSRFVRQMETNTANCSINGSNSGSNHGSNGPNGSCAAEIGRVMNTDNDNGNPEGGAEGGNGSSNAEDQNCLSQRGCSAQIPAEKERKEL